MVCNSQKWEVIKEDGASFSVHDSLIREMCANPWYGQDALECVKPPNIILGY